MNKMKMQKFELKLKDTPRNASQVSCSVSCELNKDENFSVHDIVLDSNNPDENLHQHHTGELKAIVYVLSNSGLPLMPCKPTKARKLLKNKKAKVIKRIPFTIQLLFDCEEKTQEITLGIDSGYKVIGFSAISNKQELISGEVKLDNFMTKRLSDRKMYRVNRRGKLWYRKPRFMNRVSTKKKGWLPPSTIRRFETHLKLISQIKSILPISKVIVETGNFDIQKLENPNISGIEYQQGDLYDYRNRISYLIAREKGKCQYCNKEYKKGDPWRLHHIHGKEKDRLQDLALVHESCHKKLHDRHEESKLRNKKSKSYKDSTFMNIVKSRFQEQFETTFGYITFQDRLNLGLEKSHINDAFVIAKGTNQLRSKPFFIEQKRRNNRCLQLNRNGYKPSIRRKRYKYHPKDLVKINNKIYKVVGVHSYGARIKLKDKTNKIIDILVKKLDEYHYYQGMLNWDAKTT